MKKNHYLILIILIPILFFIAIAILVKLGISVSIENYIYNKSISHMSPALTSLLKLITTIGNPTAIILICIALLLYKVTRVKYGIPISISVISASLLNFILKNIFIRQRPDILRLIPITDYSFPSAHAMVNAALYIIAIILVCKFVKNNYIKYTITFLFLTLTILIGYSRVYLGVHYAGDIFAGWLLGFSVSITVYLVYKRKVLKENI